MIRERGDAIRYERESLVAPNVPFFYGRTFLNGLTLTDA